MKNNNTPKPPYANPIPYLMDLDPTAPFEFQFYAQEMTWDSTMDFHLHHRHRQAG